MLLDLEEKLFLHRDLEVKNTITFWEMMWLRALYKDKNKKYMLLDIFKKLNFIFTTFVPSAAQ
jgi:hypothetical protein